MSLVTNITVYLRTKYNMDGILLVNVVNLWSGSCNFLTFPGALLSDAYLGRFCTLLLGTLVSMLGMGAMTLGAGVQKLRPLACKAGSNCMAATSWQLAVLFIALLLLAMGAGCIRPCNIAFGADQFDPRTEKGRALLARFYNWWYFSFTISLLVALTTVVYIQTNISWTIGFAIPTACFALSSIIFLIGCPTYIYKKPQGSIFIDMLKVTIAAYRKRNLTLLDQMSNQSFYDPPIIIEDDDDDQLLNVPKLSRSNRLNFLDKACLINQCAQEVDEGGMAKNNWTLCSVQQVEQLKSLIGILPVWLTGILCFVSMDQQNTFGILQAIQMNRKLGSRFLIPPAWIGFAGMAALSLWILSYERLILPVARKVMKKGDVRLSVKARIKIGIIMSILCMSVAAIVESKRRNTAIRNNSFVSSIHVGCLAPQLILSGLTEAFAAVTIMEFFTTQMPESMRSIAGSIFFISLSMASYLATLIVNIIYRATRRNDGYAWLGGHDLNKNHLDYFYAIIACIGVLNFFYFSFFASKFVFVDNSAKTNNEGACSSTNIHTRLE
ncbi:protein NRT1/ PTR FAMILY 2.8 isoform X2 [Beta vulgaris subsp. vulgaris]|nr:protein NRT1/ PTR FAMILY 2.8 isoform X2 [Beta vulgaris subsp. vulgaris]XP_048500254.1 protein NRT1/ PTR FAMILY 2.8 isoform X2 [Beta vulgaris subsp. vulgaris]